MKTKENEIHLDVELRKKDLYTIDYVIPAFIAGPIDKYVDREGPYEDNIERLSENMNEIILEQGKLISEDIDPFINDGIIGCLHWNKSYRILNCIIEQNVDSVNAHINGPRYELLYTLSFMGRERPVNNLVKILREEYWNINPFESKLILPVIKRYENVDTLYPNDFKSISELVEKIKLVATMENKLWKWLT